MRSSQNKLWIFIFLICTSNLYSQKQASQWYFGGHAALNFLTSPPTIITNNNLNAKGGMSSISDPNGNLLFYTDGLTIWNSLHQVMANGAGLLGDTTAPQGVVITQDVFLSTTYYIWTTSPLYRTTVDLSLAGGMGSVTVKNVLLKTGTTKNITALKMCNGDQIVVTRNSVNHWFQNYGQLVSGVSFSGSTSAFTTANTYDDRWLKFSPNANLIALVAAKPAGGALDFAVELRDYSWVFPFSNPLTLSTGTVLGELYSCEFSPDGTKLYVSSPVNHKIYQWDLCAGSDSAIVNSLYVINTFSTSPYALQLAPDGKIYCATSPSLSLINQPNAAGSACSFSALVQSVGTGTCTKALPNFAVNYFQGTMSPLTISSAPTNSLSCTSRSFALSGSSVSPSCKASLNYAANVQWNFGDPMSMTANTSTLQNPAHVFSSAGNYTVRAIVSRNCETDTLTVTLTIASSPTLTISGNLNLCAGHITTITSSGANQFAWSNSVTTSSIVVSPTATTVYSVTGTTTSNGCSSSKTLTVVISPCTTIRDLNTDKILFDIFPVPAGEKVNIRLSDPKEILVTDITTAVIYNLEGRKLIELKLQWKEDIAIVNTHDLLGGLYLLALRTKNGQVFRKAFVK